MSYNIYRERCPLSTPQIIGLIIIILIVIANICVFLFKPRNYTIKIKSIQWTSVIQVQEYQVCHKEGWETPPANAYNVSKSWKKRGEKVIGKDKDGKPIKSDVYDWYYKYYINQWLNSRQVIKSGNDKSPYYGELTLHVSESGSTTPNLNDEREACRYITYTIGGVPVGEDDGQIVVLDVSEDIWGAATLNDEINYKKSSVGKPTEIRLAQ